MRQSSQANRLLVCLLFCIPVAWAALFTVQSMETNQDPAGGLPTLIANPTAAFQNSLEVWWTDRSLLSILVCTGAYIMVLALLSAEQGRMREGAEHGPTAWALPRQANAMFAQRENKFFTRNIRLGLGAHKHRCSLNVLVIDGSGVTKARSYVKPNILEANTNYVATDPKQEVLTATGGWPKQNGYEIRVPSLASLEQSDGYNPFHYLQDGEDALKLVDNFIQAITPKGSHESDPSWTKAETALLQAIILMLFQEAPEYGQNFSMVMRVLEYAEVKEEDEEYISPLNLLFQAIEQDRPDSVAIRQYKVSKMATGDVCSKRFLNHGFCYGQ